MPRQVLFGDVFICEEYKVREFRVLGFGGLGLALGIWNFRSTVQTDPASSRFDLVL